MQYEAERGYLILGTEQYIECAKRINQYLNIPVSLVTDATINEQVFDQVIIVDKPATKKYKYWQDTDTTTKWYNSGRSGALDLTPYDRTLLVDIDYGNLCLTILATCENVPTNDPLGH